MMTTVPGTLTTIRGGPRANALSSYSLAVTVLACRHFATGDLLRAICYRRFSMGDLLWAICYGRFAMGDLIT